ncbi:MAG: hypothetical protein OEV66_03310 [Spirochaetia bacterium]|nr:hypothetical protein [Spirochaetia bacterium]
MGLSQEQITEIGKLKKLERTYDGIIKTSTNGDQLQRAKIELKKIKDLMDSMDPNGIYSEIQAGENKRSSRVDENPFAQYEMLSRFTLERASSHSSDADINMMYSIVKSWDSVFMTALFDKHVKLDYSLNSERDTHYAILANVKRYQKTLIETVEDYQTATREDAKLQLSEMKRRYSRQFLNEGAAYLRKLKSFWENIDKDIKEHGTKCTNRDDKIAYDLRFESESFLKGETVETVVHKAVIFLNEAIKALRLPELPDKKEL